MPRASAEQASRTRAAIIEAATSRASIEGLEGLTIGHLARDLRLSKAGVVGPFGSKEELQLAALERGVEIFRETVWEPVAARRAGRERLRALCEQWFAYLTACPLPGGCLLTTAAIEWDARSGRVRDAVVAAQRRWLGVLAAEAEVAIRAGELPVAAAPDQIAFELLGVGMSLNHAVQLLGDGEAVKRAGAALTRILGP